MIKPYPGMTAISISSSPMDAGGMSSPDTIPLDPQFYLPVESCDGRDQNFKMHRSSCSPLRPFGRSYWTLG